MLELPARRGGTQPRRLRDVQHGSSPPIGLHHESVRKWHRRFTQPRLAGWLIGASAAPGQPHPVQAAEVKQLACGLPAETASRNMAAPVLDLHPRPDLATEPARVLDRYAPHLGRRTRFIHLVQQVMTSAPTHRRTESSGSSTTAPLTTGV